MTTKSPLILYGIDPGSSKPWAVYRMEYDASSTKPAQPQFQAVPIVQLDELIENILRDASDAAVLITIDAPICMPTQFTQPGSKLGGAAWPFDVSPFSTRPCEKSLSSRPTVVNRNLRFPKIASIVGCMAGWTEDYCDKSNQSMTTHHSGLSVLGYQGAPHGPVVRLFRDQLGRAASCRNVEVSYSPKSAARPDPHTVYVLESHPAVTMAVWIFQQKLGSLTSLPHYKGGRTSDMMYGFEQLSSAVTKLLSAKLAGSLSPVKSDDELDALVGLTNCVDLIRDNADWWGTENSGYFLIPRIETELGFGVRDAWDQPMLELPEAGEPR